MYLKPLLSIFEYTDSCKSLLYVILLIHISDYLVVFFAINIFFTLCMSMNKTVLMYTFSICRSC